MLRAQTLNNRPWMLLLATALVWCLLLCPSLSLAMQPASIPGDAPGESVEMSGGCHSPAMQIAAIGEHGSCDNCQATEQIPGEFASFADSPAGNHFVPADPAANRAMLQLARDPIPPDHPPLFLVHEVFLI